MYCCPEHAEQFSREVLKQENASSPDAYQVLLNTVAEVFSLKRPTQGMIKQIRKFRQDGMTYEGMRLTLEYSVYYLEPPVTLEERFGIAFIPMYYAEARQFYTRLIEARCNIQKCDVPEIMNRVRQIAIDESDLVDNSTVHLIDIASMEVDDGE